MTDTPLPPGLSNDELDELDQILTDLGQRVEEIPQWEFCDGFLTALVCMRRRVEPAEYLPMLLDDGAVLEVGPTHRCRCCLHSRTRRSKRVSWNCGNAAGTRWRTSSPPMCRHWTMSRPTSPTRSICVVPWPCCRRPNALNLKGRSCLHWPNLGLGLHVRRGELARGVGGSARQGGGAVDRAALESIVALTEDDLPHPAPTCTTRRARPA